MDARGLRSTGSDGGGGLSEPTVEEDGAVTADEVFQTLGNRRRRYTIYYLRRNGGESTLGSIADHVAAWENGVDAEAVGPEERKRVYTSLQQFHLPKMEDSGILTVDWEDGVVALADGVEELDVELSSADDADVPWHRYYLGLAAVGTVAVTLSWLEVPLIAAVPADAWSVFVLTTLATLAIAHTGYNGSVQLV